MKKKTNSPFTPIRPLPGDSAPLGVINTAATRGGNESHSRGGWGPVRKDTSPVFFFVWPPHYKKKLKEKNPKEKIVSGVQVSQKQAFFRWTIQIIMTLTPPPVF